MATRLKNRMGDELERLIKAIGDCKSKSEEDRILYRAMESTKASVKSGKVDKQRTRDFLIKLLYFEMLGHDASFGHFLAVQACGSSSILTKLVGYLSVTQFLDSSDSLILLLVNTWRSDLQNDNHIIVCAALTAVCKLVNSDAVGALVEQVVTLTSHSKEGVRKKAVMALHRFCQMDPSLEAGLSGIDVNGIFRKTLCDKDPAVMGATLCAFYELAKHDPYPYRNLIPSLSAIIKQVIEHRLSKTYEYHHCPAPFIQIRLLRLMGLLGKGDKPSTDNMRNILLSVVRHANPRNTIGFAVLFECIHTITTVSPDSTLLEAAAKAIYTFLRSENSHNLKYMGLDALGGIVSINPRQAQEHQTAVMDCLEDPDDTLKLKTLELLYKMTTASNVETVVQKLLQYLHTCSDEHTMHNICQKVSYLAETYAPSTLWYVEIMIEMFEAAGDAIPVHSEHNLMKLVAAQEEDLHQSVVEICLSVIDKPKLPQSLLKVICWTLGEYGTLVEQLPDSDVSLLQVQEKMCELIQISNPDEVLQGYILTAVLKLTATRGGSLALDAEDLLRKSLTSKSIELQQRARELQSFMTETAEAARHVLPFDASCEDLSDQLPELQTLSFMNSYVQEALDNGAVGYVPESERDEFGVSLTVVPDVPDAGLRYDPYQAPVVPEVPVGMISVPSEVPETQPDVPVSVFAQRSPHPTLPVKSRRWGPAEPEVREPPVLRIENVNRLEYSQPEQEIPVALGISEPMNGTTEPNERDLLKASLFGDVTPSTSQSRKCSRQLSRHLPTPLFSRTVDRSRKNSEGRLKTTASQVKKADPVANIDLLDLSDPHDAAPPPNQAPSGSSSCPLQIVDGFFVDPFEHIDLLSGGTNGIAQVATAPPPAAQAAPSILDLDALYGSSSTTVMHNLAPPPPVHHAPHMGAPSLGIKTGMAPAMPALKKPTTATKDDPFKDLLG